MEKNREIRAVFVDLDGTLLKTVDGITPRTVAAFERIRAMGITPIIATGRLAYESDFAMKAIGADRYMIASNGLSIYDDYRAGHLFYESYFTDEVEKRIMEKALAEKAFFQVYAANRAFCQTDRAPQIYSCGMSEGHARYFDKLQVEQDDLQAYFTENQIKVNKFLFSSPHPDELAHLRAEMEKIEDVQAFFSTSNFLEIVPKGADKAVAVRKVRELMGLSKEQVMAIGDSENDLGMFEEAGLKVAMGNACDELKAKADYIAPNNKEDGVAWALETLL